MEKFTESLATLEVRDLLLQIQKENVEVLNPLIQRKGPSILIERHIWTLAPRRIYPFRGNIAHPTPSVFHAEQRGGSAFLIRILWLEFWSNPCPHGGPQHQQGQGLILEHIILLGIVKLVI